MPVRLLLPFALLTADAFAAESITSSPSTVVEDFLGTPPARFDIHFRKPAKDLRIAQNLIREKKWDQAIRRLQNIVNSELGEHALFELANIYQQRKDFTKSTAQAEKLLRLFPGSVYSERLRELIDDNECNQGLVAKREDAIRLLQRCLWRASWKHWNELEPQINALYEHLKSAKAPLLDPFVAELIQAVPATSEIRQRIAKEFPADKLDSLATLARFRTKSPTPSGIKPVYPDLELFDSAMKLVLKGDWKEANALFKRLPSEFPQSEHWDRAQYWIARSEEKLGNQEEARKRFEQILADSPFTYYGLQAALYLKHNWVIKISDPAPPLEAKMQGALTTRQAMSLWRLRALISEGLVSYAREEAKFLASIRVNGAGLGQDEAKGALMLATLFHEAGYHMAAFAHAYAALSLDPDLINQNSVSLIFPLPFKNEFEDAADRSGVNPLLLTSVAKQESAFLPNAVSRADALGLMQLLPTTAKEVLPQLNRNELFLPSQNSQAGALYLYKLLDRFQGNIALALAGYNAGPSRASQWQRDLMESSLMKNGFNTDAFIDSIPFAETRKYVGNILRNYAWYKLLANDGNISNLEELVFQWQKTAKKQENAESTKTP